MTMHTDTFVDLELHGSGDQVVGFVEGFRQGVGYVGPLWFVGREKVDVQGFFEWIRETLHRDTHVIMPKRLAVAMEAALLDNQTIQVQLTSMREVASAELAFDYVCYSAELATGVRRVVEDDLPDGVRLEDYTNEESRNESAKGVELYGPVHDYELRGRGRYVGGVEGVISMASRLSDQDFIHSGRIVLHYGS